MTPRQATCVAIGERAVLIEGAPGTGKSSLALALIDRGARLIGDDSVMLEVRGDRLVAAPHPATRERIEVRNLGLLPIAAREAGAVALLIRLDPHAPRHIAAPGREAVLGVALPLVRLAPHDAILPLKAELALATYGIG